MASSRPVTAREAIVGTKSRSLPLTDKWLVQASSDEAWRVGVSFLHISLESRFGNFKLKCNTF